MASGYPPEYLSFRFGRTYSPPETQQKKSSGDHPILIQGIDLELQLFWLGNNIHVAK
jgi:hypothetical protein